MRFTRIWGIFALVQREIARKRRCVTIWERGVFCGDSEMGNGNEEALWGCKKLHSFFFARRPAIICFRSPSRNYDRSDFLKVDIYCRSVEHPLESRQSYVRSTGPNIKHIAENPEKDAKLSKMQIYGEPYTSESN